MKEDALLAYKYRWDSSNEDMKIRYPNSCHLMEQLRGSYLGKIGWKETLIPVIMMGQFRGNHLGEIRKGIFLFGASEWGS